MQNKIVYNAQTKPLPCLSKYSRLLQNIISLPLFNKSNFLKKLFCKSINIPSSTYIGRSFKCTSGNLFLGENVSLNDTFILDYAPVKMGNNVLFSFRNMIITSTHDFNDFNNVVASSIEIGDNVWITSGVTILGGVTIGSNSVIGAGSVVIKDIPSGVFAAGNPCKEIKKIDFRL